MYCPKCGSNQGNGRKFCTGCGTNLTVVSQVLTGQLIQPQSNSNHMLPSLELERQRQMARGIRFTIFGGGLLAYKVLSFFIFSPFNVRSLFGFWTFIGFVLLGVGISKVFSHRTPLDGSHAQYRPEGEFQQTPSAPQPLFGNYPYTETGAPGTSELGPARKPYSSVTEDDTRHFGERAASSSGSALDN